MHPERERIRSAQGVEDGTDGSGRRRFLGLAAGGAVTALAGCLGSTASAARRPPTVPRERLDAGGWRLVSDATEDPAYEQSIGPVTVTAATRTLVYEDAALRREVAERTLGRADARLATFFATRATFDPDLTDLPAGREQLLDRVESASRRTFQRRLKRAGLAGVTRTGEATMSVESGAEARLTNYEGTYAFGGFAVGIGDRRMTVEGGEIPVSGHLAAWFGDDSVLVAGGAYPAANFEREVTKTPSEAIRLTIAVDLGLAPAAYREELFGLMRRVR
jgi:hypothetical protein